MGFIGFKGIFRRDGRAAGWHRRMVRAAGIFACAWLATWATTAAQAGVWRLQGVEEYRSPPYNRTGSGRFADADPYCRAHVVEIGGGRDNQSFLVRNLIPGDCHNRNGARGLEEINHQWTAPPATLVPGQPVPMRLRSTVSVLQNIGNGRTEGTLVAGFVAYDHRNEYGELGGGAPDRSLTVATSYAAGGVGATAADDGLRPAQRTEPLRVPEAPALGSDRHQGRVRLRVHTWHGSGVWASVDYVYAWDASATSVSTPAPGLAGGAPVTVSGPGVDLGQVWTQSENGWSGSWTRRGNSNTFDAVWTKDGTRVTAVLTITPVGARGVHIHRRDTGGSNLEIEYAGLVDAQGQVQGVGLILGSEWRYAWSATIQRRP